MGIDSEVGVGDGEILDRGDGGGGVFAGAGRTMDDVWREGGEVWLAIVLHPQERVTGADRTILITDAPALFTSATESLAPPNARFLPRLMPSWRLKRALATSGNLTGPSSMEGASIDAENGDGLLTGLTDLVWSNRPFEVYAGSPRGPYGEVLSFGDWQQVFSGLTVDCRGGSGVINIGALGRKSSLDNPLQQSYYRGFGMGILVPATLGPPLTRLIGAASAAHNVSGAMTLEWIGELTGDQAGGSWAPLFMVGSFYGLFIDASTSRLGFITGSTATDLSSVVVSAYQPPAHVDLYIAAVVAADGVTVRLYVRVGTTTQADGYRVGPLDLVDTLTMPVALHKTDGTTGLPTVGGRNSTNVVGVHVYEIRIRSTALSYDELVAASESPLPALGDGVADLVDLWRFGEGVGTTTASDLGRVTLTLEGAASWAPSLDGDDPAVFAGGPVGQTEPLNWGPCLQLPLVLVDSQTQTYAWRGPDLDTGLSPSFELWGPLRANGAPIVPDETISLGSGSIRFADLDPHQISLLGTDLLTGRPMTANRLIPGQTSPARTGQKITVSGTLHNNGDLTIAAEGISAGGLSVVVVETLTFETVSAPPCVIRTATADRQYTYDLPTSTARILAADQAGAFGIDATGGTTAGYSASALFGIAAGSSVDTSGLLWNPQVALGHLLNEQKTRKDWLDALALSAMAWWVEDASGLYRLITIRPPVGAPVRRFRAEIISIATIAQVLPFSRINCAYARNYHVVDKANIPGDVAPNDRSRLSTEFLLAPRNATAAVMKDFPLSKPRTDPFPTLLLDAPSASRWLDYAGPMFLEERRWWTVTLAGAWIGLDAVLPGDEHQFVYAAPTGAFEAGANARVMSVSVEKSTDRTILEVVT